jgi:hypothetical protein
VDRTSYHRCQLTSLRHTLSAFSNSLYTSILQQDFVFCPLHNVFFYVHSLSISFCTQLRPVNVSQLQEFFPYFLCNFLYSCVILAHSKVRTVEVQNFQNELVLRRCKLGVVLFLTTTGGLHFPWVTSSVKSTIQNHTSYGRWQAVFWICDSSLGISEIMIQDIWLRNG